MNQFNMSWMEQALFLAEKAASEDEVPVGAVIIQDGKIVGRGYNRREQDQNPIAHAEIQAIQDASRNLKSWRLLNCKLFVTLEPCPMCLAACQQARLSEVFYGAVDLKGGALSLGYRLNEDLRTHHRFQVTFFEVARCNLILKEFFQTQRSLTRKT